MTSAKELHIQAEKARELDNHLDALHLYDQAIAGYQEQANYEGIIEALQGKFLTYKHLYLLSQDRIYLIFCDLHARVSLEAALQYKISSLLGSIYFRLGELYVMQGEFDQAVNFYQKAIKHHAGLPAERGDYLYHLGEALYRNGDQDEGKKELLAGLREIQTHRDGVDPFLIHVWESGCYLRLADLLRDEDAEQAQTYLEKAAQIIDSDPKLVIRKRQYESLKVDIHNKKKVS